MIFILWPIVSVLIIVIGSYFVALQNNDLKSRRTQFKADQDGNWHILFFAAAMWPVALILVVFWVSGWVLTAPGRYLAKETK